MNKLKALCLLVSFVSWGAAASAECIVDDAAQAALDRQVEIIKASVVDVEDIFTGPNSCISPDLLNSFDLSNLIIDPLSLVTGAVTDAINSAISDAKSQACAYINDQVNGTIGDVNSAISDANSQLSSELGSVLQNGWDGLSL
jgi:hypothetical protein